MCHPIDLCVNTRPVFRFESLIVIDCTKLVHDVIVVTECLLNRKKYCRSALGDSMSPID